MSEDPPKGDERLDSLGRRLNAAQTRAAPKKAPAGGQNLGFAFRIGVELAAGVGLGALVGWQLDGLFGTKPVLVIVLTLVGAAGGMWNVVRLADRMQKQSKQDSQDIKER